MATGETMCTIHPLELGEGPTSAFPQINLRNQHPVLDFDAATAETAYVTRILPSHYAGGGLTVLIRWVGATATTGAVKWNVAFERIDTGTLDIDADSFASIQTATTTTSGTSGVNVETSIAFTSGAQMDSVAAGETFRMSVKRDAADGADTMAGDAEITYILVKET